VDISQHLADLSRLSSIAGHEHRVAQHLQSIWAPLVDQASISPQGNYIGLKQGSGQGRRPKVLAAAHIDSIGFMVSELLPGGFVRFVPVGGFDRRILLAQAVEIHGKRIVPGLVGSKPPHILKPAERGKMPPWEELYIDTGLDDATLQDLVPIGSPILYRVEGAPLLGGRFTARYLDNRASVAALGVALATLQGLKHQADFYAVGTVSEEFGNLPGATQATYQVRPDVAIAVDVTFANQIGAAEDEVFPLGGGITVGVGPNCHHGLQLLIEKVCREYGVPFHREILPRSSGTDAHAMQVTAAGAISGVISIPIRNMHTPVEIVEIADIERAGRILAHVTAAITTGQLEEWTCC
jgi:putative aminopeptidase FrvX